MKKYLLLLITGLSVSVAQSQEISDALRYGQDNTIGTARYRAMSGAFGALGGDLSSINSNPAGSVIFSNNQFAATLNNYSTRNNNNYFGTKTTKDINSIDLNQAGAVFIFDDNHANSDWKKFAVSLNYENANNFDNNLFSTGVNQNSIANYFGSYANANGGVLLNNLETLPGETISDLYSYLGTNSNLGYGAQQAFLGYQAYIINPVDDTNINNSIYYSNITGGNYKQQEVFSSKGYNGKLSFNGAAQYQDWLSIGMNLNSHFTDYKQSTIFSENNNSTTGVRSVQFSNDIYTYGTGFSFQVGAIVKATKEVRFGLAYESPTWYKLNDETTQSISSSGYNYGNPANPALSSVTVNPNITNVYDPYALQTPGKWTGSLAYVFGKHGLLSVDYLLKDYSNTKFGPKDQFTGINNEMSNTLELVSEVRVGGEYKIKQWSLRAGYKYEQSPYLKKYKMSDLNGYSGGLGYNFGNTKLDLAYSYAKRNNAHQFFSQGLTDYSSNIAIKNNVTMTLAFEL